MFPSSVSHDSIAITHLPLSIFHSTNNKGLIYKNSCTRPFAITLGDNSQQITAIKWNLFFRHDSLIHTAILSCFREISWRWAAECKKKQTKSCLIPECVMRRTAIFSDLTQKRNYCRDSEMKLHYYFSLCFIVCSKLHEQWSCCP